MPTFDILTQLFPGLNFTTENVMNNLNEWQKLVDENRKKGWTPKRIKEDEINGNKNNNKIYNYKISGANNEIRNNIFRKKIE